jgi:hypothetical protein
MDFTQDQLNVALARYHIPIRMHPGIIRWIQSGVKPGQFLTAIIENDLKEAINRADDENIIRLVAYVKFFYNAAPGGCWGSKEKVEQWQKQGGLRNDIDKEILKEIAQETIANGEYEDEDGE